MRKFNKILMMTVAILLTFVLISSCILSGTMAKFVVSKDATTTATLSAFGVTLGYTTESGAGGGLTASRVTTLNAGNSLTFQIKNVKLKQKL